MDGQFKSHGWLFSVHGLGLGMGLELGIRGTQEFYASDLFIHLFSPNNTGNIVIIAKLNDNSDKFNSKFSYNGYVQMNVPHYFSLFL